MTDSYTRICGGSPPSTDALAERYRILARRVTDMILILEISTGRVLEANDAACRTFGLGGSDGRAAPTVYDLISPTEREKVQSRLASLHGARRASEVFDAEMLRADGTVFPAEVSAESARLEGTDVLVCIVRDITKRLQAHAKQVAACAHIDQLFSAAADGMAGISKDFVITRANPRLERIMGAEPGGLVGKLCYDVLTNPDCHTPRCPLVRLNAGAPLAERETTIVDPSGETRHFLVTSAPLHGESGEFDGLVETLKDITELRKAVDELHTYRVLIQEARDIILFVRLDDGRILDANGAALKAYGHTREEFLNLHVRDLLAEDSEESHKSRTQQAVEGGVLFETVHRRKDGSTFPVEVSSRRVRVEGTDALINIVRDITRRKLAEQELLYLTFHDKLTGAYNRAYFEEQLKRIGRGSFPCSIIMGDLNRLKLTNDAFGHAAGDALLVETARILRESCRSDDVVARIGGDEFALILTSATEAVAREVIERIKKACRRSHLQPLKPSIALGAATLADPEGSIEETLREAEIDMYRTKLEEAADVGIQTMHDLQRILKGKNVDVEGHAKRLSLLMRKLSEEMRLPRDTAEALELLAATHDIGQVALPDHVLTKAGPLTDDEWDAMKRHPEIGYRIARTSPDLAPIAESILSHHERWDGTGYPRGLAGDRIPLAARVLTVADAFDAMTSERPYRKALSAEEALSELERNAGTQFDPAVAEAFVRLWREHKLDA